MRIAIVGLGAIARKAYLPVVTAQDGVELIFCTRDRAALDQLSRQYRVGERAAGVGELLAKRPDAAFVHTATESHAAVAGELLRAGVHVYVDKPLAYTYEESRRLVEEAERAGRILLVGFNHRFAPLYATLKEKPDRQLLFMQKNRPHSPDTARRVVFDDFIHVADTLRFLAPAEPRDVRVTSLQRGGRLHHVALELRGEGFTAFGLMDRDGGANEERLEVSAPGHKWVVRDLSAAVHLTGGEARAEGFDDWEPVLRRRGFVPVVEHFLDCVRRGAAPTPSARDSLETHALCERIVAEIDAQAKKGDGFQVPG
jgi:virulence factor